MREGIFRLDIGNTAPSLAVFKAVLDEALNNLVKWEVSLPMAGLGTTLSLMSLPIQTFPRFYEEVPDYLSPLWAVSSVPSPQQQLHKVRHVVRSISFFHWKSTAQQVCSYFSYHTSQVWGQRKDTTLSTISALLNYNTHISIRIHISWSLLF